MSKNDLKASSSPLILDAFTREAPVEEIVQGDSFEDYQPGEAFGFSDEESQTSSLLSQYLIEAIDVEYPMAFDCLDMVIDPGNGDGYFYGLINPKRGLSEEERHYALKIRDQFFSELEVMAFDTNKIAINPASGTIFFENKMSLLGLVVEYLSEKNIHTINLTDNTYSIPEDQDIADALKERMDKLEATARRSAAILENHPHYMGDLILATTMRPFSDMDDFKGSSQHLREVFSALSKDAGKGALSTVFSNGRTILAEKIRLENRNNPKLSETIGLPGYFIN